MIKQQRRGAELLAEITGECPAAYFERSKEDEELRFTTLETRQGGCEENCLGTHKQGIDCWASYLAIRSASDV